MRLGEPRLTSLERFDARSVLWFLRVLGLAVVLDVLGEVAAGVWHVHTGRFYPWRHLGIVPVYPASMLAVEWTLRAAAGTALLLGGRRRMVVALALRVLVPVLFVALLERYSNHGALLLLVSLFGSLAPPDVASPSFESDVHPALGLVRAQLAIVYVFSALNKLTHGFLSGHSLMHLLGESGSQAARVSLSLSQARGLSWLVVAAELALPFVVLRWPRAGVVALIAMHAGFSALIPNVGAFGLTMIAMALLFVRRAPPTGATRPHPR